VELTEHLTSEVQVIASWAAQVIVNKIINFYV